MQQIAATDDLARPRARGPHHRARVAATPAVVAAAVLLLPPAVLLSACGSSAKPASTKPAVRSSAQVKQTCRQVEAVLSDGPEPSADPVGYAQAQILPLREIRTTDAQLAGAIGTLASAYRDFSQSNGSGHAEAAVSSATHTIKTLCPGIEL